MSAIIKETQNMNISIEEKQEMLFRMFDLMGILPKGSKEKVEGIIIGLNIRENLECSNKN
jgi:alpha-acetolactate decarboxylase